MNKHFLFQGICSPSFLNSHFRHRLIRHYQTVINGLVLDVGCGTQINRQLFAACYQHYWGLDYIDILKNVSPMGRVISENKPNIPSPDICGDAQHLPIRSESVDAVFLTEVLEHLPRPQSALAECHRILKKGGIFILTIPFMLGEHQMPHDYLRLMRTGLTAYLTESVWDKMTVIPYNNNGVTICLHLNSFLFHDCLIPTRQISRYVFYFLYLGCLPFFILLNLIGWAGARLPLADTDTLGFWILAQK